MAQNVKKKKTREQTDKEKREIIKWSSSYWLQAPLIAIVAIIPLIVYYHVYNTKLSDYEWFVGTDAQVDFYLYCKMFLLLLTCGYMVLVLLFQHFFEDHKMIWDKQFIPLIVYAVLTILSTLFSISKYHSFHGSYQQFESVWILLGYCVIAYYTFYLIRTEEAIRRLMMWFGIGAAIMAILGMTQVLGFDFLQTKLGKTLITPSGYDIKKLIFSIEKGRTYLTLENPNYVGSYTAIFIPVLTGMALVVEKIWKKIVYSVLTIVMLVILFASQSRTGMVALGFSILVMLLFLGRSVVKHWKLSITVFVLVSCLLIGYNFSNDNALFYKIQQMFIVEETHISLQYIETNPDNVTIGYEDKNVIISLKENKKGDDILEIQDNDDIEVIDSNEAAWRSYNEKRIPFPVKLWNNEKYKGFTIHTQGYEGDWIFVYDDSGKNSSGYYWYDDDTLKKVSKGNGTYKGYFANHVFFGSRRGYIWSRTFSMIKKYFLFGSGPDTYIQAFPYDDVVGRAYVGYTDYLITKPHSMYLQIAEQTGVPSLIALVAFIGIYVVDTLRTYWKQVRGKKYILGISVFIAEIGFLVSAITNDSIIAITPIFYLLLGLGFRLNHLERDYGTK